MPQETLFMNRRDYKGLPLVEGDGNTVKVGNANPVFMMGWDHTSLTKDSAFIPA